MLSVVLHFLTALSCFSPLLCVLSCIPSLWYPAEGTSSVFEARLRSSNRRGRLALLFLSTAPLFLSVVPLFLGVWRCAGSLSVKGPLERAEKGEAQSLNPYSEFKDFKSLLLCTCLDQVFAGLFVDDATQNAFLKQACKYSMCALGCVWALWDVPVVSRLLCDAPFSGLPTMVPWESDEKCEAIDSWCEWECL